MNRSIYSFLTTLLLLIVVVGNTFLPSVQAQPTPVQPSKNGSGVYEVDSLANLYWITQNSSSWSSSFVQTANIDASSDTSWDSSQGFTPIGNGTTNFTGTYDGGGHTITGLYINRSSTYDVGMFGYATSATIENIGLVNVNITGHVAVGGLVGDNTYGTVTNCYSSGSVTGSHFYDGSNYGSYVGGLIGGGGYDHVSQSYSSASANGQIYVAGFIGYIDVGSVIENSYSTGSVSCQYTHYGGFAGSMVSCTVTNCYATGNVSGPYGSVYAGGFVGDITSVTLTDCYSIGSVSGTNYVGGFSGFDNGSSVNNCFWNIDTYGGGSADGTGKTTAQMGESSTFINSGWTFSTTGWAMYSQINGGYPYLPGVTQFSTPSPSSLSAITSSATNISYSSALLIGNVSAAGDTTVVRFLYGTSPGSYTDSVAASSSPLVPWDSIQVSASLSGLKSGTLYYFCVSAKNASGYVRGSELCFATLSVAPPTVITGFGFTAQYTTANVNGIVDPNGDTTTVRFLCGDVSGTYTDSVLASQSPLTISDSDSVTATLTGLMPNHIYYYRVSAINDSGYTRGSEMSFHTLQAPSISTVPGSALSFNSSLNQYVSVPDNSSLELTDSLTFEVWVYPTGSENMAIIDKGNYNYLFEIRPNGQSGLGLYTNGTWYYSSGSVPLNHWSHVALVFQRGTNGVKFYLNGSLLSEATASGALTTNTGEFAIGKQGPGNCDCNFFQGMMDEVRVWDVPRTEQQIRADMYKTLAGTETGLVSYWQFNEVSGDTVYDVVGGNKGVLTNHNGSGAPTWVTSEAPVGKYGSYDSTSSADSAGLSGSIVETSITSPVDSLNYLGLYSFGSPLDTAVTNETFPSGITKRSSVIWGIFAVGNDTANVTLNYSGLTGIQNESGLKVIEREEADSPWVDVTSNFAQNLTNHTFTETHIDSFSQFAIGTGGDNSLNVQATDFVATADVGLVTIKWKTRSELENAGFNVLREDAGMKTFKLVSSYTSNDSLRGLGTSSTGRSYDFMDTHVVSGSTYNYKIQSVSTSGTVKDLTTLTVTVDNPKTYALYQNYPNPFNPSTTIRFDLKEQSDVTLEIYNVLGQRMLEENYGAMNAGRYNKLVNMDRFASAVYFYRISAVGNDGQKFVSIKKLVLMK
ncbi:MAG TPA: LamG-like jellyroll fold domain-containing protein [Candidatus Kryptonia bacterium]